MCLDNTPFDPLWENHAPTAIPSQVIAERRTPNAERRTYRRISVQPHTTLRRSISVRTLLVPAPLAAGDLTLDGDESHHGLRVLRLRPGDAVRVADGAGRLGEGVVASTTASLLTVTVGVVENQPPCPLHALRIIVAPPKGDRWTDLVRGLTELGVGSIAPLRCARGEREPASLDRARRVAAEALKQCRRGHLPEIGAALGIDAVAAPGRRLIVADRAGGPAAPGQPQPTTIVIGPEGGLTDDELAALDRAGAHRVRLAGPILRIETAALAAAAVWASAWEHAAP